MRDNYAAHYITCKRDPFFILLASFLHPSYLPVHPPRYFAANPLPALRRDSTSIQPPPFRHCASRSVSKGTTYHNHNESACSSRSTEQLGTLFFSFDLPTGQFSGGWLGSGHPPPSEAGAGGEKTEDRRRKSGDRGAGDRRRRKGECSLWRKSNWTNRQPGKYGHILRAPGLFLIGFAAKRNPLQGHSRCLMQ